MGSRFQQFRAGALAELPLLVGVFPFGMIYGALAKTAGIPTAAAQSMSFIVFAGSSQFVLARLYATATPAVVMLITLAVINLRHALYSASISPFIRSLPLRWKIVLSYLLTDEAYAVAIVEYERTGIQPFTHWFFLGAGLALWTIWQISTGLGIIMGQIIPDNWPLDFALVATFIAIVVPLIKDRASLASALVAGVVAVLTFNLPYKLGLIVAALAGIVAGMWVEAHK